MRQDGQRVGIADWRSARPVFLALLLFALCLVALEVATAQSKPRPASQSALAADHHVYLPLTFQPGGCAPCFNATIPDTPFPDPDPADFHFVGDDLAISTRELLLVFRETTTVEEAGALLATHDATVVGGLPQAALLLIHVPPASLNAMMALLADLNADPRVEVALPEMGGRPAIVPPHNAAPDEWDWAAPPSLSGSPTSGNWGLKLIRAPQMWNLDTFVRRARARTRVTAGVVDDGFTDEALLISGLSRHPDLKNTLRIGARIPVRDHGTMVAGIIGADAENGRGVEGIDPWIDTIYGRGMVWDFRLATWGRQLDAILRVLLYDRSAKAVNNSYALSSFYLGNALSPGLVNYGDVDGDNDNSDEGEWGPSDLDTDGVNDTWGDVLDFFGSFYKSRVDRFVEGTFGRDKFFLVAAAGNTGPGYLARYESPVGNAAARFGGNFVAVESLAANNRRSAFSVTGGTIAAPGECIRTTEAPDGVNADDSGCDSGDATDPLNATASGTSFSAPYVTGLITALWKLEPALTVPDVRALLTGAAFTANVTGAMPPGRRIDAFAAAMGIDRIRGTKTLQAALVDVDDGTPDGNLLLDPRTGQASDAIATDDQRRGDGRVTMRDFRAWRDAYLQTRGDEFPGEIALAGPTTHFKRDLNLDGCVGKRVASPAHPVDVPAPSSCANAPDSENLFPRYDFNGDGVVATWNATIPFKDDPGLRPGTNNAFLFQTPPGRLRDLDVLGDADFWQTSEVDGSVENVVVDPALEGQQPDDSAGWRPYRYLLGNRDPGSAPRALKLLPDYLHSFDLHLSIAWDAVAADYEALSIQVAAEMRAGFSQRFTREIELRRGEQPSVLTVPLWTGRVRVSLDGIATDQPALGPDDRGYLEPDALEWSGLRFGEDRALLLPRLFTTLVDDVAPCESSMAVDGAGNIAVAYEVCVSSAPDGSQSRQLYLARSTDGGASFTSRLLASGAVRNHALAVASNGDIYVAYVQGNPSEPAPLGNASVQFVRSADGGQSFSAPAQLSTSGATNIDAHVALALDGSGRVYALWAESGSDRGSHAAKNPSRIRLRTSSSRGANFAPPVTLHSDPEPGRRWWPRIARLAVTPAGEVHATWRRCNSSDAVSCLDFGLLYSRSLGSGGFSEPVEIARDPFLGAYGYDLAADAAGRVSVVYGGGGSNSTILYVGVRDGAPTVHTNVSNTPEGLYAFDPTIATDGAGTIWVAWSVMPPGPAAGAAPNEIFVSRSTDRGSRFSRLRNLSGSAVSRSGVPALALDGAGLPLLLWAERSPPGLLVRPVPASD